MPNQIEISHLDTQTTIHLKMNGELLYNQKTLGFLSLITFDIAFVYLSYEAYTGKESVSIWLAALLFLVFIIYLHLEYRANKNWIDHGNETLIITKNSFSISKRCFEQTVSTIDIDTRQIIEIFYAPWIGGAHPPYLPDFRAGNIHIHTYNSSYSVAINLNQEEAKAFIIQLRSLIMQFQEPRHFIFVPHLHLAKE